MDNEARKVLVTRQMPEGGLDPLIAAGYEITQRMDDSAFTDAELVEAAPSFDGIVCLLTDKIDSNILEAGARGSLRVVANAAVGYDNIDIVAASKVGVAVCNTPGVLDQSTADLAFLLILAAARLSSDAERDLREGRWSGWGISDHLGRDVHGGVLGLIGYGRIAREVSRRAEGFGMEVLHHARRPTGFPGYVEDLDELLSVADAISIHVPLTEATRNLISKRELGLMKPTSVLVNTSRGTVLDEDALCDALEEGSIFAAGLDVYASEPAINPRLIASRRTVLLPHIGSATTSTRTKMVRLASQGVVEVLSGRTPGNLVTQD